jgi:hypothetical protein
MGEVEGILIALFLLILLAVLIFYCDWSPRMSPGAEIWIYGDKQKGKINSLGNEAYWMWEEAEECFVCSNCLCSALNDYRGNSADSEYCPHCGKKMDNE